MRNRSSGGEADLPAASAGVRAWGSSNTVGVSLSPGCVPRPFPTVADTGRERPLTSSCAVSRAQEQSLFIDTQQMPVGAAEKVLGKNSPPPQRGLGEEDLALQG